jgi:Holliday junction resolvase RusA-like endonuclease
MTFILKGPVRGGKNHMLLDPRTGRHYPSSGWAAWRDQAVAQLWPQGCQRFTEPVSLLADYYPPDRRRRDATALLDAVFHVLEHASILVDDSLVKEISWKEFPMDKENPRIILTLDKIG